MKYYQTSLGQLSETLPDKEKENISKLTVQFLTNHDYFSTFLEKIDNSSEK